MQVDPIKPTLKAPGTKRLKMKHDEPLSNFAFKLNLRRYTEVPLHQQVHPGSGPAGVPGTLRGRLLQVDRTLTPD